MGCAYRTTIYTTVDMHHITMVRCWTKLEKYEERLGLHSIPNPSDSLGYTVVEDNL